jgi:hypothetical protein
MQQAARPARCRFQKAESPAGQQRRRGKIALREFNYGERVSAKNRRCFKGFSTDVWFGNGVSIAR